MIHIINPIVTIKMNDIINQISAVEVLPAKKKTYKSTY